jgi:hypothetical protein
MTVSTVQIEKLRNEAISVNFLKILPEPVERKPETEKDSVSSLKTHFACILVLGEVDCQMRVGFSYLFLQA